MPIIAAINANYTDNSQVGRAERGYRSRSCDKPDHIITLSGIKPHFGHVVSFLDKTLYDDYLARWLRTSSKFSGQKFEKTHKNIGFLET